jgi:hypothetical protein
MIARAIVIIAILALSRTNAATPTSEVSHWNPKQAVIDAERDITSSIIRFAFVGAEVPFAPAVPDTEAARAVVREYPRLEVGFQGCTQDKNYAERDEYARRYNLVMWKYVSSHR